MIRRSAPPGRAARLALAGLVACLPLALPGPQAAAATALAHPGDDWAGSQVALHEGAPPTSELARDGSDAPPPVSGLDVSGHQGAVDWAGTAGHGAQFAYVKATESVTYRNPAFAQQYAGARAAGLLRGAYHFATPDTSDGVTQANYFLDNGGAWAADGRTLPPALDLEYNPYGDACYGLPPAALVAWAHAFSDRVRARTGRYPTIYTSTRWWATCMGNDAGFGATNPLWIARYNTVVGNLPPGWAFQTFWQYADSGPFPGDQDSFNGDAHQLHVFAAG